MKKLYFLFFGLFIFLAAQGQKQQQERIIRFHSDIVIETDGTIEVTEHIKVYAAGEDIQRGIIREIPVYRKNTRNKRVFVDINVVSVQCNEQKANYSTEYTSDNIEIRIGDADIFLKPGEYDYVIQYTSRGHIGFFDDFDELYWSVTGNEWIYPIEQASATVTLPDSAKAIRTDYYTGYKYGKGKDCTVEDQGNVQIFTATRKLLDGEGLTVAVAFPRNIIQRPPPPTKGELFWDNHKNNIGIAFCLVIIMGYYLLTLRKAGKRPNMPVVIPTFKPPQNMSPTAASYLYSKIYESGAFAAGLVEMAVKGAIAIRLEKKGIFKKYFLDDKKNTEKLRPEEQQIHATLFAGAETVEVGQDNRAKFVTAGKELEEETKKQWNLSDYFCENTGRFIWGGMLVNALILMYLVYAEGSDDVLLGFCVASPFVILGLTAMFGFNFKTPKGILANVGCLGFGFLLMFVVIAMALDNTETIEIHWMSALFFTIASLSYRLYTQRIRIFTPEGAKINAELEGLRVYMKTAEEHRLNMLTPPDKTPELFEKLLPYAIALNVSNEWCKKFDNVLKQFDYKPEWYTGDHFSKVGFVASMAALSTSLSSSLSSAQSTPSSSGSSSWSSGSDGGGYSGGGGGGGGGRGW